MRKLNFLRLFYGLMLVMVSTAFVSCVDDNNDTEAPYLEVSPTTLTFGSNGQPVSGSQASFDISTNRSWKATVKDDKSWVTLSKYAGEGSATIQVSIPENINGNASIVIEISNKVGVLMSETITILSGDIVAPTEIYKETVGTASADGNPAVGTYTGWNNKTVTYSGTNASVRSTQSNVGGYEGASGPNNVFFAAAPADFIISGIPLTASQTRLQLTFGSTYVKDYDAKDYTFDMSKFEVYLSGNGTAWAPLTYTKNNGDAAKPNWILATANFTLAQPTTLLYIKFVALDSSKFRLDDITLSTGNGGVEIDLGTAGDPKVTTADAKAITDVSATLGGSAANLALADITEVGVQYATFSTGTVADIDWTKATKVAAQTKETPWTVAITSLTKGAQYAYRAYATTASGSVYGESKTFVAMEAATTSISIANLVDKMTATAAAVDNNYVIQGVICGDPAGKNYSYGTLYLMTKGATTAGNALSLYNNQIDVTQYALGQEIKVTLLKDVAKIYKRYDVPQVEGFTADNIEVVSQNNTVAPIKVTLSQLATFVCMPVTVDNVNTTTPGVWKTGDAAANHTFNVGGTSFTVNINKNATPFNDQPFGAATASMTGIASVYQSAGQLMPRNLEDVKGFVSNKPMIVSVDPATVNLPAVGGSQIIEVTTVNQGSNTLSINTLSGILSAKLENGKVTVTAQANDTNDEIKQDLVISITNGNSITVPVKVSAKAGSDTKGTYTSLTPFLFASGTDKANAYAQPLSIGGTTIESLKLGTSSKSGAFTTGAVGVSGNKKLSFYASAWKGESMTVYVKVNGGGSVSGKNNVDATANGGVSGTGTFTVTFSDADYYTLNLTGLTPQSTITIATDANFDGQGGKARGVMCGFQLY